MALAHRTALPFEVAGLAVAVACAAVVQSWLPLTCGPDWVTAAGFGLPLTAGLLLGRWALPTVAVGAAVGAAAGAVLTGAGPGMLAVALAAVVAEAGLAVAWRRNGLPFAPGLDRPSDVVRLALGGTAAACGRGLAAGLTALAVGLPEAGLGAVTVAVVGTLGNLILPPLLLVWRRAGPHPRPTPGRAAEAALAVGSVVGLTAYWFAGPGAEPLRLSVPVLALLLGGAYWVAFRFDTRGMTAAVFGVAAVTLVGAARRGTFAPVLPLDQSPLDQWGFLLGQAAVVGFHLTIAAVARDYKLREADRAEWAVAARRQTERLREVNERLALQSLELSDQTAEVERQRDDYQALARELADKRAWLETVLAQLPVGILLIDKQLQQVHRNRRFDTILGLGTDFPALSLDGMADWPTDRADGQPLGFDEWPLVRAIQDGATTHAAELRIARHVGGWAEVSAGATPIRGTDGEVQGAVLVLADVAAVRRAERAARENERRLRFALKSARMMAWEWDLETDRVSRSDALEDWLGLPADPRHGVHGSFADRLHPDDRAGVKSLTGRLRAGRLTEFVVEYRLRHADGSHVWVESRGQCRAPAAGRPAGTVVGVLTDVTARRRSEERLRLLESAVVHAHDAVIVLDATPEPGTGRRVRYVNAAFTRITGYERDEALDRSLHFLRGPDTDTATLDRLRQALDAYAPFAGELLNYRKDGTAVWVDLSLVPVAGPDGRCTHFVMIQRDVTDRRRAEQAVRLREEQLRAVGDNLPDGLLYQAEERTDGQGIRFRYLSAGIERLTGLTAAAVVADPMALLARVLPEDVPLTRAAEAQAQGGRERYDCEFRVRATDGQVRWLHARAQPFVQPDGDVLWNGVMIDITARKKAEAAVRESEQLFRGMFETTSAGVSVLGPDGTFLSCNPAFAAMLGRPVEQILGHCPGEFTHPDDWAAQQGVLAETRHGGRDQYQVRKRYRRPDGRTVWTELSSTTVRGPAGEYLYAVGVSVDMTARQTLEEQLRQSQKMEALGQMAGGIAHDFNNLLTAVIGNLGLVKLADADPARPLLRTVEQAATRAADLTRKLLGYARRNQLLVAPVRPGELLGEVADILRRTLDPRIEMAVRVDADPLLSADATLINQAVFNLCLNARDAMPHGGTLTLTADAVTFPDPVPPPARPGAFARLTVTDTGTGMTAEVRERLFEPFFTTKGVGKGTGLGLPMVHGIMTQHDGWVTVDSAPGQGTRFELYLPAAGVDQTPPPRTVIDAPPTADGLTVLLVDDEAMIRALARAILESDGHTVLEAEDGQAAVELFEQEYTGIDLVLLDLTMPRLSGRDAFRRMIAVDPSARVLFSSGYSADDVSEVDGARGLLSKPYRPADLLTAVRRAVAEEAAVL